MQPFEDNRNKQSLYIFSYTASNLAFNHWKTEPIITVSQTDGFWLCSGLWIFLLGTWDYRLQISNRCHTRNRKWLSHLVGRPMKLARILFWKRSPSSDPLNLKGARRRADPEIALVAFVASHSRSEGSRALRLPSFVAQRNIRLWSDNCIRISEVQGTH
jgi:hypothetical protein